MLTASIICMALGALLVLAGYLWQVGIESRHRYKGRTTGVVAEIVAGEPDTFGRQAGIHDYYFPVLTYYADGILYREQYEKGSNPSRYGVNDKVEIRYNERHPQEFELYTKEKNTELAKMMYYAGLVCCCIGGIFFLIFATRG